MLQAPACAQAIDFPVRPIDLPPELALRSGVIDAMDALSLPWPDAAEVGVDGSPVAFDAPIEWSEEDLVLLHWRLLREIQRLAEPDTPLEEKLDTLRWVFTERHKDAAPFSFVSCLRVVGCSPLSPLPYCGLVDPEEVRDRIRAAVKPWLRETLLRYPAWVREAVLDHPDWVAARLAANPQWLNEETRRIALHGDLFA